MNDLTQELQQVVDVPKIAPLTIDDWKRAAHDMHTRAVLAEQSATQMQIAAYIGWLCCILAFGAGYFFGQIH